MKIYLFCILIILLPVVSQENKGIEVVEIQNKKGQKVFLYQGSYALLIGVSDYTHGWQDLESIPHELEQIEKTLKKHGFKVEKVMNPNSQALESAFANFKNKYGFTHDNRLLFFFSGHGHTITNKNGRKKGYLVPTDAPDPQLDETNFLRKALYLEKIHGWAKEIDAKHVLFLFDSCFSGMIFKSRALPKPPAHISSLLAKPVRQYISAGSANQLVPAQSFFARCFIKALRGRADLNKDSYITGTELGLYLHQKVMKYNSSQTPQYGKIRDPDLDEGDFVFVAKKDGGVLADIENSFLDTFWIAIFCFVCFVGFIKIKKTSKAALKLQQKKLQEPQKTHQKIDRKEASKPGISPHYKKPNKSFFIVFILIAPMFFYYTKKFIKTSSSPGFHKKNINLYESQPYEKAPIAVWLRWKETINSNPKLLTKNSTLKMGALYQILIKVKVQQRLYILALQEDSKNVKIIFPHKKALLKNPLVPGNNVLPAKEDVYKLDNALGPEKIYIFYDIFPIKNSEFYKKEVQKISLLKTNPAFLKMGNSKGVVVLVFHKESN